MKGFYAFAAAVALGSMISASAFNFNVKEVKPAPEKALTIHTEQVTKADLATFKKKALKHSAASLADELDLTKFSQFLYFDYFFWKQADNTFAEDMVRTSCGLDITEEDGKVLMKNFFGYTGFDPVEFTPTEYGLDLELGQVVYVDTKNQFTVITAAIGDELLTEGSVPVYAYSNALAFDEEDDYWFGFLALNSNTGASEGWLAIGVAPLWFEPNATITYTNTAHNSAGQEVVTEVNNRIYCEYDLEGFENETEAGTVVGDILYLSNITQWNEGFMLSFVVLEDGFALPMDSYVYGESDNSGRYLYELASELIDEGQTYYTWGTQGAMAEDKTFFTFPYTWDPDDIEFNGTWFAMTEETYYLGDCTAAEITFDYPINEDRPDDPNQGGGEGIESIVDDAAASAVFFNLQGMKVENPQAGQVYIVKKGNQTIKKVIR